MTVLYLLLFLLSRKVKDLSCWKHKNGFRVKEIMTSSLTTHDKREKNKKLDRFTWLVIHEHYRIRHFLLYLFVDSWKLGKSENDHIREIQVDAYERLHEQRVVSIFSFVSFIACGYLTANQFPTWKNLSHLIMFRIIPTLVANFFHIDACATLAQVVQVWTKGLKMRVLKVTGFH